MVDVSDGLDLSNFRVVDDADDDPILLRSDGTAVDTWREDYPYTERLDRQVYEREKRLLQIELLKLQEWIKDSGERLVIVFEGRDAAGKGGTIKRFLEHLNPRGSRVVALDKPSTRESRQWYFQRYVAAPPRGGRDRAVRPILVQPRRRRTRHGVLHGRRSTRSSCATYPISSACGCGPVSISSSCGSPSRRNEQRTRFLIRQIDPVRQWKLSPTDLASLDRWQDYTEAKEAMFFYTDTASAPWTVIKSNDKKRARLEAMRHVLSLFDYTGKDEELVGEPDPSIVGQATQLIETGERSDRVFPQL